jgi:hypothetical protein
VSCDHCYDYADFERTNVVDEALQACIKECREEIGRARGRREKLLGEDYARSDYIYGLESAIEIIEKVMKEGP